MNDIYDDLTSEYLKIKSTGNNIESKIFGLAKENNDFHLLIKNEILSYLKKYDILINFDTINKKIENFNPNIYQIKKNKEKDPWQPYTHNNIIEFNIDNFIKFHFSVNNEASILSQPSIIASSETFTYYMNCGNKNILVGSNKGFTTKINKPDEYIIQSITNFFAVKIQKKSSIILKPFENIILLSKMIESIKNADRKESKIKKLYELNNLKEGIYTNSDFITCLKDFNSVLFLTKDIQLFKDSDLESFNKITVSNKKININNS